MRQPQPKADTTTTVFCTFTFEAFHRWRSAPRTVAFLRSRHRHLFHVRLELAVGGLDREREFILLKRDAEMCVRALTRDKATESWSCEHWATWILQRYGATRVEVSEDGENGAVVCAGSTSR